MRGMLTKVDEKIPIENSLGTIFPPFREFEMRQYLENAYTYRLRMCISQKKTNLSIYLSNKMSHKLA